MRSKNQMTEIDCIKNVKKIYIYFLPFTDLFSHSSLANTTDSLSASGLGTHRNWLQGLPDSPLIQPVSEGSEDSGQKELKLRFDVSQYSPEEIVVKTVDNKLLVRICSLDSFSITQIPYFWNSCILFLLKRHERLEKFIWEIWNLEIRSRELKNFSAQRLNISD